MVAGVRQRAGETEGGRYSGRVRKRKRGEGWG